MPEGALPLRALNHVSFVVGDVGKSAQFYKDVLGFRMVRRPQSFDFEGCWLWRMGLGIHLICGSPSKPPNRKIEPKSDHLSFLADDLDAVERQLDELGIRYVVQLCNEGDICIRQLFFHDPDSNMIEVCNCDEFPLCQTGLAGRGRSHDDFSSEHSSATCTDDCASSDW